MNIKYLIITLVCGLISCNNKPSIKFEVTNKSIDLIKNVQISCTGCQNIETLEFNDKNRIKYRLDMSSIPKTDGNYKIVFYRDGETESKAFGYYTNGHPINSKYEILILEKNIEIKEE